ncbi:MAG TPA: isoprenylcysteine carboxylmethyltransferase family protein [Candidatus Bilamarchaeum sp.]|nr:isoprenylcysteine carboxylmethyltransferase family protein [Candidatus Bilamarchaeum sp.]
MDTGALTRKIVLIYVAALVFLGIIFFVPAGTTDYWQAWAYMAVVLVPAAAVVAYFLRKDPEFLERRFRTREKEARQQAIIKAAFGIFIIAFIVPGLDRRFGWSAIPPEISLAADALVFLGYALVFLVFRENSYAGRTIEVEKGQKVISTGPYSIVRHPMYLGSIMMYMATPIALGSYFAFPLFLLIIPVFVFRILNEEEVLRRDLPGYAAYCEKTKYRLLPLIW